MINSHNISEEDFSLSNIGKTMPNIRIKQVIMTNFKSVQYGSITLNCESKDISHSIKSDILGIYGQNGSGKTSFIEALYILKQLLSGHRIPDIYADCITIGTSNANLEFHFDLQFTTGEVRELVYSFSMSKAKLSKDEIEYKYRHAPSDYTPIEDDYKVVISNELIRLNRKNISNKMIMQDIIDTSVKNIPFGPSPKLQDFIGKNSNSKLTLEIIKRTSSEQSRSFIFNPKTLNEFKNSGLCSIYLQSILYLNYYAKYYLFVIDTKSSGLIRLNIMLPLYTRSGVSQLNVCTSQVFSDEALSELEKDIESISAVLSQLVPGLSIKFKKLSDTIRRDGSHGNVMMLVANRDGKDLPLRDESDGIRKIISILSLLIAVYNNSSFTLAIDEFDAGIFEYLLGEILQTMEETGKGQFIFTSHNLRPLEVIDKKFLIFTTTNPNNRFYKIKNIGQSNNLRDMYFREILLCEQDEELYNRTKRFKIESALRKAGIRL